MRLALPLALSLLCLGLGGCGQKGPLFLPTDPPASQAAPADGSSARDSTAGDTALNTPATPQ